uniref:t-SNARE coiled-coil homology domain-containing protein n=1 Tax=Salmo trutta TaxID=8032 RepID=A0A674AFZ3_SALTR
MVDLGAILLAAMSLFVKPFLCKAMMTARDGVHSSKPALSAIRQHSDFTLMAKRIGKDLSNTFSKLEKLTILAKRKSLFDDKAVEVEELTYIVKQDINSLNKQIAQLQGLVRSRQSQNGKHLQTHSNTIIVSLQSKLASMSNDFKSMLEVRTEVRHADTHTSFHSKSFGQTSFDLQWGTKLFTPLRKISENDCIKLKNEILSYSGLTLVACVVQDSYIRSQLGSIFQQLAHMVKEQEETVQSQLNVDMAHSEILMYFQSASSNHWLMVKIFLILIVFFFVFVVFFA